VGLSCLSGAHNQLFPEVVKLLREKGGDDILVVCGGIIPYDDIPLLKEAGISAVFQPGTSTEDIIAFIKAQVERHE
jgi:methylmalonyl-CoA mutase C-terminal domain/subunit